MQFGVLALHRGQLVDTLRNNTEPSCECALRLACFSDVHLYLEKISLGAALL